MGGLFSLQGLPGWENATVTNRLGTNISFSHTALFKMIPWVGFEFLTLGSNLFGSDDQIMERLSGFRP